MTMTTEDHAPGHIPDRCDDCDHRAHMNVDGISVWDALGCMCPVCICMNVEGVMIRPTVLPVATVTPMR